MIINPVNGDTKAGEKKIGSCDNWINMTDAL